MKAIPFQLTSKALALPFVRNYGYTLFFLASDTERRFLANTRQALKRGTKRDASARGGR